MNLTISSTSLQLYSDVLNWCWLSIICGFIPTPLWNLHGVHWLTICLNIPLMQIACLFSNAKIFFLCFVCFYISFDAQKQKKDWAINITNDYCLYNLNLESLRTILCINVNSFNKLCELLLLLLLLVNVSKCKSQHFVTFVIRKENLILFDALYVIGKEMLFTYGKTETKLGMY